MSGYLDKKFISDAVEQYSDTVLRIAFQHTKNKAEAEDIMQEVFLELVKGKQLNDAEHLKAWLIRVTINKSRDHLRKTKRRKETALDTIPDLIPYGFEKEDMNVAAAIHSLPEIDRNIVYLFYFEGYSASEIGDILKKREGAVYVRLKRIREKLKESLGDRLD